MTTTILFIIIGVLAAVLIFILAKRGPGSNGNTNNDTSFQLLLQQMNELSRTVDAKLSESQKITTETIRHQTNQSHNIIREVTEHLTELKESNKQVMSFTDQLKSFQDILKNPKQRGTVLGEYYLETILSRVLPPKTYQTQYQFNNGQIADAVIFVDKKIIPVDSKFSLENYNRIIEANQNGTSPEAFVSEFKRDIKNRIDETSKYILPGEETLDFAFMFIPHESIYYDLLVAEVGTIKINTQDLVEYAFKKKVIIVSPTSFLAYLQTVLQGLRALNFQETFKETLKKVEELGRHLKAYDEYHGKLGASINTVVNHYTNSSKEFKKIDKDVMRITGESIDIQYIEASKIDEE